MLERYLIEHCSPTLASLKTANLFNVAYACEEALYQNLSGWNQALCHKGVQLFVLRTHRNTALIYVFRKARLENDLQRPGVERFLFTYGYVCTNMEYALERLKTRLADGGNFPHEIGVFLGYPLGDVIGFIENAGQNCKCAGCWKVYCNECEAVKTFARFNKCRDIYLRLWKEGRSVLQLTVAV